MEHIAEQVSKTLKGALSPTIPQDTRQELRGYYRRGEFDRVFPAGSGSAPPILVGREAQAQQLIGLLSDVCYERRALGIHGVVIHGPRGTGKTALLNTFDDISTQHGAKTIRMDGNGGLQSFGRLMGRLSQHIEPREERTKGHVKGLKVGITTLIKAEGHAQHQALTKTSEVTPDQDVLSSLESMIRNKPNTPVLLIIDEAHGADASVLGELMNAVQTLGGGDSKKPIGFVLGGTPDLIDLMCQKSCQSTWFRDRAQDERFAPMSNDLATEACLKALTETLTAVGVTVEGNDVMQIVENCKGSPYFLQQLGKCALESASQHHDVATFEHGGEIDLAFKKAIEQRYASAWKNIQSENLSSCARQLGALWRSTKHPDDRIRPGLLKKAIRSGLKHAPHPEEDIMSFEDAQAYFKHLGLLWATSVSGDEDWSLGLPSFFDYVESRFQDPRNVEHHAVLPELEREMNALTQPFGRQGDADDHYDRGGR